MCQVLCQREVGARGVSFHHSGLEPVFAAAVEVGGKPVYQPQSPLLLNAAWWKCSKTVPSRQRPSHARLDWRLGRLPKNNSIRAAPRT